MTDPYYRQAISVLPDKLFDVAQRLAEEEKGMAEELRLRRGAAMSVVSASREHTLDTGPVAEEDLRFVLEQASRHSAHRILDKLNAGYVTIRGGHRIGVCGQAVMRGGEVHTLDTLSSVAVRIARSVEGNGPEALEAIREGEGLCSALILAPPGAGKTTLLRETVRRISDGIGTQPRRVGLADERGEVAAMWEGVPQLDVGQRTDVMSGCPKALGMSILLRSMTPQVLAVDEITAEEDTQAMAWAAGCGVTLLATAHGGDAQDLMRRPLYRRLMELGIFRRVLVLQNDGGKRSLRAEAAP